MTDELPSDELPAWARDRVSAITNFAGWERWLYGHIDRIEQRLAKPDAGMDKRLTDVETLLKEQIAASEAQDPVLPREPAPVPVPAQEPPRRRRFRVHIVPAPVRKRRIRVNVV